MNKILYITGVICLMIVAIGFTVTTFTEPVVAKGQIETDICEEYTVKEFFSVSETPSTVTNDEEGKNAPENSQKEENATETILEGLSADDWSSDENAETAQKKYYDVPLGQDLQDLVITDCARYGISPAVVYAMIEKESNYNTYAIGDDGRSFGLMQIQPKWHLQRMIDMDCTDLFDPKENIKVGLSILGELYNDYGNIEQALTVYNKGYYDGVVSDYARTVMKMYQNVEAKNNG